MVQHRGPSPAGVVLCYGSRCIVSSILTDVTTRVGSSRLQRAYAINRIRLSSHLPIPNYSLLIHGISGQSLAGLVSRGRVHLQRQSRSHSPQRVPRHPPAVPHTGLHHVRLRSLQHSGNSTNGPPGIRLRGNISNMCRQIGHGPTK